MNQLLKSMNKQRVLLVPGELTVPGAQWLVPGYLVIDWPVPGDWCLEITWWPVPGWLMTGNRWPVPGVRWPVPGCPVPGSLEPGWLVINCPMPVWLVPGSTVPSWLVIGCQVPGWPVAWSPSTWLTSAWWVDWCLLPGAWWPVPNGLILWVPTPILLPPRWVLLLAVKPCGVVIPSGVVNRPVRPYNFVSFPSRKELWLALSDCTPSFLCHLLQGRSSCRIKSSLSARSQVF